MAPTPLACSKQEACPKNHIIHSTNTTTTLNEAKLHLEHHKNTGRQGPIELEVAQSMVKVWALMESASLFLDPNERGIVLPVSGSSPCYSDSYMSTIISNQLSKCGFKVGANDVRHLFSTMFSLYLGQAVCTMEDLSISFLRDAAAAMTGSSPVSWNRTYDANARVNGYKRVLHHYPAFKEFVQQHLAREQATVPRNPISGQLG